MSCYEIDGLVPVVAASAYIAPTASVIGDVHIGDGVYVGPGASLRGDFGRIIIAAGANVQDNCVMHGFPGGETVVEEDGHIGHAAVLHGCRVAHNALVGIGAIVLDLAIIGESALVAAGAVVPARMTVPPRTLVAGVPATVKKQLRADEIDWKQTGTAAYQQLTRRAAATMRPAQPLEQAEANRRRVEDIHPALAALRPK